MAKKIDDKWIKEKIKLLEEKIPKNIQKRDFFPDALFYIQYIQNPNKTEGLQVMAATLFVWLDIQPNGCMMDFGEPEFFQKQNNVAGFYTKIPTQEGMRELVLINPKYKEDALHVGAILSHELMHLYLNRVGLTLEDRDENELLTDLATIQTGLAINVINGMSYDNQWFLTLLVAPLGFRYWSSEKLYFGYFDPNTYGKYSWDYLKKRIQRNELFGYVNPKSRNFIPHTPFFTRSKNPTPLIKVLETQDRKGNLIKWGILIGGLLVIGIISPFLPRNNSVSSDCSNQLTQMKSDIDSNKVDLTSMESKMNSYKLSEDTISYNSMVPDQNLLASKINSEMSQYNSKLQECKQ